MPRGANIVVNMKNMPRHIAMAKKAVSAPSKASPAGGIPKSVTTIGYDRRKTKKIIMILYPLLEALGVPDMLSSLLLKDCLSHSSRTKRLTMTNLTFSRSKYGTGQAMFCKKLILSL